MPARHYRVEYTEDDTNYTLLAADEAPGKGQAHPVTGLSAGTHTGKLRLTPLNGDAPVASLPFTFTLGSVPVSEPVQSIAAASATVADVLTMRDNLMAAIGVTAAPADTMAANDQLTVAATVQATAADLKVFSEQLLAAATSDASVATVQAMAEQLLVAVAGAPSVLDVQRGTIVESLVTSITVDSTAASVQTMAEQLVAAASPVATIADVRAVLETVLAAATATATVTDTYTGTGGGTPTTTLESFATLAPNTLTGDTVWTATGAWSGWTIANQGYNLLTAFGSGAYRGARIVGASGAGYYHDSPYGLMVIPSMTPSDPDTGAPGVASGFKLTKTWTGPFPNCYFAFWYRLPNLGGLTGMVADVNGSNIPLVADNTWRQTTPVALTAPASITLTIQNTPGSYLIQSADSYFILDTIAY